MSDFGAPQGIHSSLSGVMAADVVTLTYCDHC